MLGYKILSIAAYAGCCWLIWSSLPPSRRAHALVAFAWSPLVLFDVLGKVHNDVLPALSLLALFWQLSRRAPLLGLPAVAAGGLIKITALAAAPALLVYLWRHHHRAGSASAPVCEPGRPGGDHRLALLGRGATAHQRRVRTLLRACHRVGRGWR